MLNFKHYIPAVSLLGLAALGVGVWMMRTQPVSPLPDEIQSSQPAPIPISKASSRPQSMHSDAHAQIDNLIQQASIGTARKLMLLDEIIQSKNDNDPRLDQEFKNLSHDEKSTLIKRYGMSVAENLNERGTLVFLVGREAQSPQDLEFLQSVMSEKPCLSMANCKEETRADSSTEADSDHAELGASTTLVYPQLVAIEMLKQSVLKGKLPLASVIATLEKAKKSESSKVVASAEAAILDLGDHQ